VTVVRQLRFYLRSMSGCWKTQFRADSVIRQVQAAAKGSRAGFVRFWPPLVRQRAPTSTSTLPTVLTPNATAANVLNLMSA